MANNTIGQYYTSLSHPCSIILHQLDWLTYSVIAGKLKDYMLVFRVFYRTRIPICTVLMFLLLASTAFASQLDGKREELQNINAQIDATKDKKDAAAKRQAEVRRQIQLSDQRMVQVQIKLNKLQTDLNDTIAGRQNAEAKLTETQKRLDEMQAKLDDTRKKLALRREAFNNRLVHNYKNGEPTVIAVLLNSENFGDFIKRFTLISIIAEADGRLILDMKRLTATITSDITQVEATKKAIDQQRLHLIAEENRIDTLKDGIIAEQEQLQNEMDKQQQLYAQIQQEKEQLAQTESQLKASSNKLAEQIRMLERQNSDVSRGAIKASSDSMDVRALAEKTAIKYGIPTKIFLALIKQESGWNHRAVSRAGAIGLTQVMPFNIVAMGYDIESFKNSPADQLEAGAKYLSMQYKTFGRWDLALAAYNAGPGAVMKHGGIPPYKETRNYVRSILSMAG